MVMRSGAPCLCQIFTLPSHPGKLKNLENLENRKTDILTGDLASQNFRISGFQVFNRPQMHGFRGWGVG